MWSARLDALERSTFELQDSMAPVIGRRDSQAKINCRYAALRRAIRAEVQARARVLREVDLRDSVPSLPQEASEA
jgi:hypothetical protein